MSVQGDDAVPPSGFGRFSSEPPASTHLALLARCIMDPNCADNLDDEGNHLVMPDISKRQETLTHLQEANELIRRGTCCTVSYRLCPADNLGRCWWQALQMTAHTCLAAHLPSLCPIQYMVTYYPCLLCAAQGRSASVGNEKPIVLFKRG